MPAVDHGEWWVLAQGREAWVRQPLLCALTPPSFSSSPGLSPKDYRSLKTQYLQVRPDTGPFPGW